MVQGDIWLPSDSVWYLVTKWSRVIFSYLLVMGNMFLPTGPKTANICSCIWHESVRVGEISKCCHNFLMFSTSSGPEWSLCRGQIAVPGHKSPRESNNVIHTSWPRLDDQVEAFQVGVIPLILNIEVTLQLIHNYSTFKKPFLNAYSDITLLLLRMRT